MKVLDHEQYSWFLLDNTDGLYFDVYCNHSAVGYSVLIKLSSTEQQAFHKSGREYLNELAHTIHYSAPIVKGTKSPYKKRILNGDYREQVTLAVKEWRELNS